MRGRVGCLGTMPDDRDYKFGVLALCAAVVKAAGAGDAAGMRTSAEGFYQLAGEWAAAVDNRTHALYQGMPARLS